MLDLRNRRTHARRTSTHRSRSWLLGEPLEQRILLTGDGGGLWSAVDEFDTTEHAAIVGSSGTGDDGFASASDLSPEAPVVETSIFAAIELAPTGTLLGAVRATDANGGALTYRLLDEGNNDLDGDGARALRIAPDTGRLFVNDGDDLDLALLPASVFAVRVQARDPGGLVGQATQLIYVIPTAPAVTVDDVSTDEGGDLVFTVTLDKAVAQPFDVNIALANGSATGAADGSADFDNSAHTISFAGDAAESHQFTVSTTDDGVVEGGIEGSETFTVRLDANSERVDDSGTGIGTITDNDLASISVEDASGTEGSNVQFTLVLDNDVQGGLDVEVQFADGSATGGPPPLTAPADYDNTPQIVTFSGTAGETQVLLVNTLGEGVAEPDETFTLNLTSAVSGIDTSDVATGMIINNRLVEIGSAPLQVVEGAALGTVVGAVDATDADGDRLTFRIITNANPNNNFVNAVAIDGNTGTITVTDPSDFNFELSNQLRLSVQVTEHAAGVSPRSVVAPVVINVTNDNEAPRIDAISPVKTGLSSVSVAITGVDPDAGQTFEDSTSFQLVSLETIGVTPLQRTIFDAKLAIENGNLFFNEFGGNEKWLFSTRTGAWFFILPDSRIFEWNFQGGVLSGALVGQLAASVYADPSLIVADNLGGPVSRPQDVPIPASQAPVGSISGNVLTVESNGFLGTVEATVRVTDPGGLSDERIVEIEFVKPNRSPVIAPIGAQLSAVGASTITIPLDVTDPDGDTPLNLAARVVGPVPVRLAIVDRTLTITRNSPFFAAFDVVVTANDGRGGNTEQTFQARFVPEATPLTAALRLNLLGRPDRQQMAAGGAPQATSSDVSTDVPHPADPREHVVDLQWEFDPDSAADLLEHAELAELDRALGIDIWGDESLIDDVIYSSRS